MLALRKAAPERGLRLEEVPVPAPAADEVLVEVETASVCGTDLHIYGWDEWSQGRIHPPLTLGHEFAGTVTEVGPKDIHPRRLYTPRDFQLTSSPPTEITRPG